MMKQKQGRGKFICAILAMAILWVGMYFQMMEIDSLFLCKPDGYSTAAIYRADTPVEEAYLFRTQEITNVREALIRYQQVRRAPLVRGDRLASNVLIAEILSALFSTYLVTVVAIWGKAYASNTVILQFIHRQDGEK